MGRRRRGGFRQDTLLQGVLVVDKPPGVTSHAVCQSVKSALRVGKVGHGGTLDPFATGLLPLLINGATRLMPFIQSRDKVYEATVRLGQRTDTMDPTGEVIAAADPSGITREQLEQELQGFLGKQQQVVPRFSAARVDGKHLYEYARAGEDVEQPSKEIEIFGIDLLDIRPADETVDVDLLVHSGAGTYVRALADDLGERLGVHGHLATLRRTRVDALDLADGVTLDAIVSQSDTWRAERTARIEAGEKVPFEAARNARTWRAWLGSALKPVTSMLGAVSVLRLDERLAEAVASGTPIRKGQLAELPGADQLRYRPGDRVVVEHPDGLRAVALVRTKVSSEALGRLGVDAVVMDVERVLR